LVWVFHRLNEYRRQTRSNVNMDSGVRQKDDLSSFRTCAARMRMRMRNPL
jgi:hypothetical protein